MRFAVSSPFVPFLRPLAVVPLAVAGWLAIPAPTSGPTYLSIYVRITMVGPTRGPAVNLSPTRRLEK